MKRFFIIGVLTLVAFVSCKKENPVKDNSNTENNDVFYLTAALEQGKTKAELNSDLETVWKSGDAIGVYITNRIDDDWETIQSCSLNAGDDGKTLGNFAIPSTYPANNNRWNNFAFFPYGSAVMGSGTKPEKKVSFKLPVGYNDYYSGKFVLPLMANMRGDDFNPSAINFNHVGGGVKITLNGIPVNAHTASMTVTGQKITSETTAFPDLDPANAGTESGKLVATASTSNDQTVNLNFSPGSISNGDFVFPVPTIPSDGTQKLVFNLWSNNDLLLWTRSASVPNGGIGRADLLEFVTPIELTEAKIKSTVIKKNNFYLRGWNVEGDEKDYSGSDYSFTNGTLYHTFNSLAYINIYSNGHTYQAENNAHYYCSYVDFDPTDYFGGETTTGNLGIILNYGDGKAQTQNGSVTIGDAKVYYVSVTKGSDDKFYVVIDNPETSHYSGMDSGLANGKKRIWIRADGDASFNGLGITNAHLWNGSNTTTWPGLLVSKDRSLIVDHVTLSPSYNTSDKVAVPAGAKRLTLSYNIDGTLNLLIMGSSTADSITLDSEVNW